MEGSKENKWAVILGGSSGLGLGTAKKLSAHGYRLMVIHRDRRSDLEQIESNFRSIALNGNTLVSFNMDATNPSKTEALLPKMIASLNGGKIHALVHSIAKGNLKPMLAGNEADAVLKPDDFAITINAMATSLYHWVQLLHQNKLFAADTRIIAYTSEGNQKAWPNYGAVSAAKAALEAIMRNIALEFASVGITANCIQAGVTETKSFAMIPGHQQLKSAALQRNPNQRLTEPQDVANATYLLTRPEAKWITGTVIKVDGGESLR